MKRRILDKAVQIARCGLQTHPEISNFPHYSFIVQHNKIIEWATNCSHEPPVHWGYHRRNDEEFRPKFHAEIWAYKRAKGLLESEAFEIINVRLNRKGSLKLSKPCLPCSELLAALGCKMYYYSWEGGFLKMETT